uniref:Ubiquitin-like domain-containing protein n=1 Tax=Strigamia maritima TaxID=126957 RepID=T1IX07_STRMM
MHHGYSYYRTTNELIDSSGKFQDNPYFHDDVTPEVLKSLIPIFEAQSAIERPILFCAKGKARMEGHEEHTMEQFLKENESTDISVRQIGQNNICTTGNSVTIHFNNFGLTQNLENFYRQNSTGINPDVIKSLIPIFENYRVERFEIKIKSHKGIVKLDVHPLDTIQCIKLKLQLIYGILFNKQYLVFEEKVLEDEDNLQDCNLSNASVIHMVYPLEENGTAILFQRILGRMFCLRVDQESTIKEIKIKIEEIEEIPIKRQRLFLDDGTTLNDETKVINYNIGKKIVKLAVTVEQDEMVKIMVKSLSGKMLLLCIGMHDTVEDLKCLLEAENGVKKENQRI